MGIPALAECRPGITPTEFNILIAPEPSETKSKGGIILLDNTKQAQDMASMKGRLVAISPLAFSYERWPEGARQPQVGDVVLFAKFAGVLFEGADGREYRAAKDKDLIAVYDEEQADV